MFIVTGKSKINDRSYPELMRLIELVKEQETVEIEISGHKEHVDPDKINDKLPLESANLLFA